jgi:hypothetical protein
MEYLGAGRRRQVVRRVVVRRIRRVVDLEVGIREHLRGAGLEGHNHAAADRMEVARAEHGIRAAEEMARHRELPVEEGHRSGLAGAEDNIPVEAGGNALAEGGIVPVGEDVPVGEEHHKAADTPGAEVLKEGPAVRIGADILRTEVLLTGLASATRNAFNMRLTVRVIRHDMQTVKLMSGLRVRG